MSTSSQFSGGVKTPKVIVNKYSVAGVTPVVFNGVSSAKQVLSGALTANTLATALSITGAGELNIVGVAAVDATSRTLRLKVTLDGTSAFDCTSASNAIADRAIVAIGTVAAGSTIPWVPQKVQFKSSCLVEIASSLTETDKLYIWLQYATY